MFPVQNKVRVGVAVCIDIYHKTYRWVKSNNATGRIYLCAGDSIFWVGRPVSSDPGKIVAKELGGSYPVRHGEKLRTLERPVTNHL